MSQRREGETMCDAIRLSEKTRLDVSGRLFRVGAIRDEFWHDPKNIPEPANVVARLAGVAGRVDVFSFGRGLYPTTRSYGYRHSLVNLAVASFDSYNSWRKQINKGAKSALKSALKSGVRTQLVPYDDDLVKQIHAIYNETPCRHGKMFLHYGD